MKLACRLLGAGLFLMLTPASFSQGIFTLGGAVNTDADTGFACNAFTVAAQGIPTLGGEIEQRQTTATPSGTVLFFSGGEGVGWWSGGHNDTCYPFFDQLNAAGYDIIQVRWNDPGWIWSALGSNIGQHLLAERPATVIRWVAQNMNRAPHLVVVGSSNGSTQLAYSMALYGAADVIDIAVPVSGPPYMDICDGCQIADYLGNFGYPDYARNLVDLSFGFNANTGPCYQRNSDWCDWETQNSVEQGGVYNYPLTTVRVHYGQDDQYFITQRAMNYYDALYSAGMREPHLTLTPTPQTAHSFQSSTTGLQYLFNAISTPADTPVPTPTPTPTPTIQITVQTNPVGLTFSVDGTAYSSVRTFSWVAGSSHTIATTSPQNGVSGVRCLWSKWSDNGTISHTVAPTTSKTYTASFTTQYYLTMSHGTGGTVTPVSGWRNSGATVSISATPTSNSQVSYNFARWTSTGAGSYTGTNNPASITMNGPITETAAFTQNPVQVTVQTSPSGPTFTVDGSPYTAVQSFSWQPGSSHTIATTSPQSGGMGVQYVWKSWSDNGTISHTVAPTTNKTYTANFTTQYYLTMNRGTGGTVTPASGWRTSGAAVSISATPASGYSFSSWTGSGPGSYNGSTNPVSITMGGPITETAAFTH